MQGDQVQSLVGEPRPHMPQLSLSAAAREAHSMKIQHSQDRWKEKNLKKILSSIFKKVLYMFLWSWTQTSYILFIHIYYLYSNFIYIYALLPSWLSGKEFACQCRRYGFDPRVGKIPWRRKMTLQYSCLGYPTDGGAWQITTMGSPKSWTWLND